MGASVRAPVLPPLLAARSPSMIRAALSLVGLVAVTFAAFCALLGWLSARDLDDPAYTVTGI
jgi:hypothetical protein